MRCPRFNPSYRWLGFELSVLRRLRFRSAAVPFAAEPGLELSLKRWGVRVATNDTSHWAWTKGVALVENNHERLDLSDVELVLADAYVPRHRLKNPSLARWFGETDAWWFHNVRENAEKLSSPAKRALALAVGMAVGDYVFSFDAETREYRLPLSQTFWRLWATLPAVVDNGGRNKCTRQETRSFLAEQDAELLFLRLPPPRRTSWRQSVVAWREEWVRGDDSFWPELEAADAGALGAPAETKRQYLFFVQDFFERASHIRQWAVAHVDNEFISTEEFVETVRRVRRVETIYTKDFSELTGLRAAVITTTI